MATYRPNISETADGLEQRFEANLLSIESSDDGMVIALGEDDDGTPINSLMLQISAQGQAPHLLVEFNDQGNQCSEDEVEELCLSGSDLRVVFRPSAGIFSGRVSLSEEADIFDQDDDEDAGPLRSICVGLAAVQSQSEALKQALTRAAVLRGVLKII
jgi:hypothetical protein